MNSIRVAGFEGLYSFVHKSLVDDRQPVGSIWFDGLIKKNADRIARVLARLAAALANARGPQSAESRRRIFEGIETIGFAVAK